MNKLSEIHSAPLKIPQTPQLGRKIILLFANTLAIASHIVRRAFDDDSVLCRCRLLWERSLLFRDLCGSLSLGAAASRDCRGLSLLLRNAMCVLLARPLDGLRVPPAGNRSREVTVNKSPPLISLGCICFQIRGLVCRSNTSGFCSLPLNCQSEESDLVRPAQQTPKSVFKVCFLSFSAPVADFFCHIIKVVYIIHH